MTLIRELIFFGKFRRLRGIRDIQDFMNSYYSHLLDVDVDTATAELGKYRVLWESHLETLKRIGAGRVDIYTDQKTHASWKWWMGKYLRDICPEDFFADYEIPNAEAMLGRLMKLADVLKRLARIDQSEKVVDKPDISGIIGENKMITMIEEKTMIQDLTPNQRRILASIERMPSYQYGLTMDLNLPGSTVYGALIRLYADGLVERCANMDTSRRKNYYRITAKGRAALKSY